MNNDAASSAGVDSGGSFSPKRAFEAAIAGQNKRGGLDGRPIKAVYASVRSSAADYAQELQSACTTLTQDNHPVAVLSTVALWAPSFYSCVAQRGLPVITGDYALGDGQALAENSNVLAGLGLTTDDRARLLLRSQVQAGRLTSKDKLGVLVEGCAWNVRTYQKVLRPEAARLGLTVNADATTACFNGFGDFGSMASQASNAVLKFRSAGVTAVTFVSGGSEGNLLLLFAQAAQGQGYMPRYAITSGAAPVIQEANTPPAQLANASGLGWLPALDTTQPSPASPGLTRCLADLRAAGLSPAPGTDRLFGFGGCDTLGLLVSAAKAAGSTTRAGIFAGASALGRSFAAAGNYAGRTDLTAGRRTGPAQGRTFSWSGGCKCFTYTGTAFPLT